MIDRFYFERKFTSCFKWNQNYFLFTSVSPVKGFCAVVDLLLNGYVLWGYLLNGYILQYLATQSSLCQKYSSLVVPPNAHWSVWATDEMHCSSSFPWILQ